MAQDCAAGEGLRVCLLAGKRFHDYSPFGSVDKQAQK
jgi:hypothetical protein